jgi:hypothetical protein
MQFRVALNRPTKKKKFKHFPIILILNVELFLVPNITRVVKHVELELFVDYTRKVMNSTIFQSQLAKFIGLSNDKILIKQLLIQKEYQICELEIAN